MLNKYGNEQLDEFDYEYLKSAEYKERVRLGILGAICVYCGGEATTVNQAGEASCESCSWTGN